MRKHTMITRRSALLGAAGALLPHKAVFAKASQPRTSPRFPVPPDACDCHTHVFGNPKQFPLWDGRSYTPEPASPEEMLDLHRALHIQRVVIVTPSIYGTDNSVTLYGMKKYGKNSRAVAVIGEKTSEKELDAMAQAGMRGIRLNLTTAGQTDPAIGTQLLQAAIRRVEKRGWHVQMNTNLRVISGLKGLVNDSPVPVVFDHFGGLQAALGLEQPHFSDLVELVRSGKAYVKLSAPYRSSLQGPDYPDLVPFAKALIQANTERVLWGTDWPHPNTDRVPHRRTTDVTPLHQIDDGSALNQIAVWTSDPAIRKKILVDNPARLYQF